MKIVIELHPKMLLPIAKGLRTALENEFKNGWDYPNGLQSVKLLGEDNNIIPHTSHNSGYMVRKAKALLSQIAKATSYIRKRCAKFLVKDYL